MSPRGTRQLKAAILQVKTEVRPADRMPARRAAHGIQLEPEAVLGLSVELDMLIGKQAGC